MAATSSDIDRVQSSSWLRKSGSMPLGQTNFGRQSTATIHFCEANADVRHDSAPPRQLADLFRPSNKYHGTPPMFCTSLYGESFSRGDGKPGLKHNHKDDACLGLLGCYPPSMTDGTMTRSTFGAIERAPKALVEKSAKNPWKPKTQLGPCVPRETDFFRSRYQIEHTGGQPSAASTVEGSVLLADLESRAQPPEAAQPERNVSLALRRCGTAPAQLRAVDEPAWPASHYRTCFQAPETRSAPHAAMWDAAGIRRGRFRVGGK